MKLECVKVFHCVPRLKMLVAGIGKINLNKSHVIRYPKHANRLLYLNKAFYSETTRNLQ